MKELCAHVLGQAQKGRKLDGIDHENKCGEVLPYADGVRTGGFTDILHDGGRQ